MGFLRVLTSGKGRWRIGLVILVLAAGAYYLAQPRTSEKDSGVTFEAHRGNLAITINEGGEAVSLQPQRVKCEVDGHQIKILRLVEEGYRITQEDIENKKVLVELDSSDLEKEAMQQDIQYHSAMASLSKAHQDYEIQEEENASEIQAGERDVKFMAMDLRKYLGELVAKDLMEELTLRRTAQAAVKRAVELRAIVEAARLKAEQSESAEAQPNEAAQELAKAVQSARDTFSKVLDLQVVRAEQAVEYAKAAAQEAKTQAKDALSAAEGADESVRGDLSREARLAEASADDAVRILDVAVTRVSDRRSRRKEWADAVGKDDTPALAFASIDFEMYANDPRLGGEAAQKRSDLEAEIMLERETAISAEDRLEGTRKLFERNFVTQTELKADELAVKRLRISVQSKETSKELFFRYEFPKEAEEAFSKYEEALRKLERVKKEAETKLQNADVAVQAAESKYELQEKGKKDVEEQLSKCLIYATHEGLVTYGDPERRWGEKVREGAVVRSQMTILTIPDITVMGVAVQVHESSIKKVAKGQEAEVRVEAFPDTLLTGEVYSVGVMPDSERSWMNPDLKTYEVKVSVDGVYDWLKPGMTADVKIDIKTLEDVIYVPLQAVSTRGSGRVVYLANGDRQPVETGEFNETYIEITSGLEDGDTIRLRAIESDMPDEEGAPEQGAPEESADAEEPAEAA
ncbi:MAG: HlyD family efflux transporter periplasmic adaptor subunit [bacterium]|nr:HlyD family efflux transporter periplasmic adaptor subunit [bacterium]